MGAYAALFGIAGCIGVGYHILDSFNVIHEVFGTDKDIPAWILLIVFTPIAGSLIIAAERISAGASYGGSIRCPNTAIDERPVR